MATELSFVQYINTQSGLGASLTYKRMFGEYAIYVQGKVVGFACDNQLYIKPTVEGKAVLGSVAEHPPYPGAKLHFRLDGELEDRELLQRLLQVTAQALPLPKPKAPRVARTSPRIIAMSHAPAPTPATTRQPKKTPASDADKPPGELIDSRIAALQDWRGAMLAELRRVIVGADPDVIEEWKWNTPVWSCAGIICTGETYKKVVKLTFAKGAQLEDPSGLFNSSLTGKTRRAIDVSEGGTIDKDALRALIRAAVRLNKLAA